MLFIMVRHLLQSIADDSELLLKDSFERRSSSIISPIRSLTIHVRGFLSILVCSVLLGNLGTAIRFRQLGRVVRSPDQILLGHDWAGALSERRNNCLHPVSMRRLVYIQSYTRLGPDMGGLPGYANVVSSLTCFGVGFDLVSQSTGSNTCTKRYVTTLFKDG